MRFLVVTVLGLGCGNAPAPAPTPAPSAPEPTAEPAPPPEPEVSKDTDITGLSDDERRAFLMALGEKVYKTGDGGQACITCHMDDGQGMKGAFPPLVGQKDLMGDCKNHAGIIINGMKGEIVVDGITYNSIMVPQGDHLNDLQIASVISYVRQSWGNDYGLCSPEDVAAARSM
ncbi:MAG: cytochrome c [Myxococcales bacterium]|nr:cytochrome c [Myxococcales bacterium]